MTLNNWAVSFHNVAKLDLTSIVIEMCYNAKIAIMILTAHIRQEVLSLNVLTLASFRKYTVK